jgi:hypothetical protein
VKKLGRVSTVFLSFDRGRTGRGIVWAIDATFPFPARQVEGMRSIMATMIAPLLMNEMKGEMILLMKEVQELK